MSTDSGAQFGSDVAGAPAVPPPIAPPTVPGMISRPPERPAWPTVIGIIAIVFGAMGMVQNIWGGASMFLFDWFTGFVPEGEVNPFDALVKWRVPLVTAYVFATLTALLLLLGGVWLIMRRSAAAPMLVTWAVLKIVVTVVLTALTAMMQMEQFNAMATNGQPGSAAMTGFMTPMLAIGAVFGIVWGWALPVFILIWFARARVKQTVRAWRDERAGLAGAAGMRSA